MLQSIGSQRVKHVLVTEQQLDSQGIVSFFLSKASLPRNCLLLQVPPDNK